VQKSNFHESAVLAVIRFKSHKCVAIQYCLRMALVLGHCLVVFDVTRGHEVISTYYKPSTVMCYLGGVVKMMT
jgi:hypothetical protein